MNKCLLATFFLCLTPILCFAKLESHVDMKIVKRDGTQRTYRITNNAIDASVLDAVWDGATALSDTVTAAVSFWGGDPLEGIISAASAYSDVRDLIADTGDKTATVLDTTRPIDIDQTEYIELTFEAFGDSGVGRLQGAAPRLGAFSVGGVTRSRDFKHATRTVRIVCRGAASLAGLLSGPYVIDFFAKEGSDSVGGPDGCHTCLAAHHLITIVLTSSTDRVVNRLPLSRQQEYRRAVEQLENMSAHLRQTYVDYDAAVMNLNLCNMFGDRANCATTFVKNSVDILVRRQALQTQVDNLVDKILAIFFGGGIGGSAKHVYVRAPLKVNIKRNAM